MGSRTDAVARAGTCVCPLLSSGDDLAHASGSRTFATAISQRPVTQSGKPM